jgi:hypothetical protein
MVACGYCLAFAGVMQSFDTMADALGDPNLKDQISAAIGDAKTGGRVLLGISIVTIAARLRSSGRPANMRMAFLSFLG